MVLFSTGSRPAAVCWSGSVAKTAPKRKIGAVKDAKPINLTTVIIQANEIYVKRRSSLIVGGVDLSPVCVYDDLAAALAGSGRQIA